ncbi:predicted protein [Arabidopsis lyrata subsp. lyrata]|uniref:Predicted protein n=1 Tax=Arabidopsis lyrata subsp. lyrata TaxID=81972 RepID=D7LJ10_ARALL|nr:predicted protein [Arabidopsis lyrata subsp. lyrata]
MAVVEHDCDLLQMYRGAAKELRSFTDLGLKEVKALVEKTHAILKARLSKEEDEKIVEKLKALGVKVIFE